MQAVVRCAVIPSNCCSRKYSLPSAAACKQQATPKSAAVRSSLSLSLRVLRVIEGCVAAAAVLFQALPAAAAALLPAKQEPEITNLVRWIVFLPPLFVVIYVLTYVAIFFVT